ncbi:elongation factor P [Patescibacteria group bacterium]|nr:elongation factor P [Patescibacteria group bacterium]
MLSHVELKKGTYFVYEGAPCLVLEHSLMFKGRGSSVMQVKLRNLKNGNVLSRTFHTGDEFEEAELEKLQVKFIYENQEKYVFAETNSPSKRFELTKKQIGSQVEFLIQSTEMEGVRFQGEILTIALPIKMNLKVKEAPPGIKGDRAVGGTKTAILETGAVIQVPLFVDTGDEIEVNTQTSEYVRRVQ